MADVEGWEQRHEEAAALAQQLVGLDMDEAVQRVEQAGFPVRTLHEGDVVTLEFVAGRVNLTYAADGTVLRASAG
jgi:hypothetical protein